MPALLLQFLNLLEDSSWAETIRQSLWLYPALEIIHIIGIVMLVGGALFFDLRLLGFSKNLPVNGLSAYLLPFSRRGLILVVPSGLLLFITNAKSLGVDPTFWLKMSLLVIASLNVLVFHKYIFKSPSSVSVEGKVEKVPFSARISALVSIMAWAAIIACGRLLAY
ncbi:DUF6644 family protein [Pedobacter immunditicola]|uniref:DUF6644 family protein n=1 Tax=Pedobacter immunditicola TaxID=3133440 RepID=UPI0030B26AB3